MLLRRLNHVVKISAILNGQLKNHCLFVSQKLWSHLEYSTTKLLNILYQIHIFHIRRLWTDSSWILVVTQLWFCQYSYVLTILWGERKWDQPHLLRVYSGISFCIFDQHCAMNYGKTKDYNHDDTRWVNLVERKIF